MFVVMAKTVVMVVVMMMAAMVVMTVGVFVQWGVWC